MDPNLKKLEALDTDHATHLSLWFGIGGFIVGLLGVAISFYTLNATNPSIWVLTLTGWAAALLAAISLGYVASKLVKLASNQARVIQESQSEITRLKSENARLIEIDSFVISKAIRAPARKSHQQANLSTSAEQNAAEGQQ